MKRVREEEEDNRRGGGRELERRRKRVGEEEEESSRGGGRYSRYCREKIFKIGRARKRCLTPGWGGEELWENYSVSQTKC